MTSLYKKYFSAIILTIILFGALLPGVASANIAWGGVLYNPINAGTSTEAFGFKHEINYGNPQNPGTILINAVVDVQESWIDSDLSQQSVYFLLSKDAIVDADDVMLAEARIKDSGTIVESFDIALYFTSDQMFINDAMTKANTTTDNGLTMTSELATNILIQKVGDDINTESQTFYACASHGPSTAGFIMIENTLGCSQLGLSVINKPPPNTNPGPPSGGGTNPGAPVGAGGTMEFDKLKNPLCATTGDSTVCSKPIESVTDFIERILNIVVMIGMPIVVLALIWAGFLYVKAQGNPSKITEAHQTLLWTIIGAGLLMGSWAIANAIKQTVVDIGTGAGISSSVLLESSELV